MPESSSEDGNDSSPDSPLSPPVPPVGGFREETISKEKQKFFRLNSFYGIKGRGRQRCKAEGRPIRDLSSSSNSSSSDNSTDVDKSKISRVPPITPKSSSSVNDSYSWMNKSKSSTSCKVVADRETKTAVVANQEKVANEPFGSFGTCGQCVTFEDLARKCKAKSEEKLPVAKNSSVWLHKPKPTDDKNASLPNHVSRILCAKVERTNVEHTFKRATDDKSVVKNSVVHKSVEELSHTSDSWHNLIKPSSSIVSQKPNSSHKPFCGQFPHSQNESPDAAKGEELWGFAAAAARKKVDPVLRLVKEGAPAYTSYNVFVSGLWSRNSLKAQSKERASAAGSEGGADADTSVSSNELLEDLEIPKPSDQLPLSLSPSQLVKSAVLSKQYEHVRRNMLSCSSPLFYVNQLGDVVSTNKETLKKKLIAEATKTHHFQVCRHLNHLSVQPVSVPPSRPYNLFGKRITSYLLKTKKKKKKNAFQFPHVFQIYR